MKLGLKKYFIFARSGIQTTIAYRGQIALWFLGGVLNALLMGLLWWAVFSYSEGTVGGYTYPQMLMYVLLSAVVGEVTYNETISEISRDVHHGLIEMRLMKPISYRAQLGFTAVGSFAARVVLIGIPLSLAGTLVAVYGFGLPPVLWYNVLLTVPACFLSVMTMDALGFLFGQLAFRTHAMFGINSLMQIITGFLSGGMVPLALFPGWAQSALMYTPFPTLMSTPVRLYMGFMGPSEILIAFAISAGWIVALNVLGSLMYKTSVRKVVVFGG